MRYPIWFVREMQKLSGAYDDVNFTEEDTETEVAKYDRVREKELSYPGHDGGDEGREEYYDASDAEEIEAAYDDVQAHDDSERAWQDIVANDEVEEFRECFPDYLGDSRFVDRDREGDPVVARRMGHPIRLSQMDDDTPF